MNKTVLYCYLIQLFIAALFGVLERIAGVSVLEQPCMFLALLACLLCFGLAARAEEAARNEDGP